jgi:hypothetical protein
MRNARLLPSVATVAAAVAVSVWLGAAAVAQQGAPRPPTFEVDRSWPTVPNGWVLGEVTSIAVDSRDHIWVHHRPRSIPADQQAKAAPPVLEFDAAGTLLGAGAETMPRTNGPSGSTESTSTRGGSSGSAATGDGRSRHRAAAPTT